MTHSERARAWFKRHAYVTRAPSGEVTGYHVTWSEEVERSLEAEMNAAAASVILGVPVKAYALPDHPPWRNQTNYEPPRYPATDQNHGHLP